MSQARTSTMVKDLRLHCQELLEIKGIKQNAEYTKWVKKLELSVESYISSKQGGAYPVIAYAYLTHANKLFKGIMGATKILNALYLYIDLSFRGQVSLPYASIVNLKKDCELMLNLPQISKNLHHTNRIKSLYKLVKNYLNDSIYPVEASRRLFIESQLNSAEEDFHDIKEVLEVIARFKKHVYIASSEESSPVCDSSEEKSTLKTNFGISVTDDNGVKTHLVQRPNFNLSNSGSNPVRFYSSRRSIPVIVPKEPEHVKNDTSSPKVNGHSVFVYSPKQYNPSGLAFSESLEDLVQKTNDETDNSLSQTSARRTK